MQYFPAADRNKEPILSVLKKYFTEKQIFSALEVGSGSGQHITYFAKAFPSSTWQPSEIDQKLLESILNYTRTRALINTKPPILLDAAKPPDLWLGLEEESFDLITAINLIHITPYSVCEGLFKGSAAFLKPKGLLFLYGPFAVDGKLMPESNIQFDKYLRQCCADWGVRDTKDLKQLAEQNGLDLINRHDMPANNKALIFQKR